MLNTKRKINIETDGAKKAMLSMEYASDHTLTNSSYSSSPSDPISARNCDVDYVKDVVSSVIADEFPELTNNSLIHELVTNSIISNMNTVQSIKNVLLYSKENSVKEIKDVFFEDGDVYIKCSI